MTGESDDRPLGEYSPPPIEIQEPRDPEAIREDIRGLIGILEPTVEQAPDPDLATADLVEETGEAFAEGDASEQETVAADAVGLNRLDKYPDNSEDTREALEDQPAETLEEAAEILGLQNRTNIQGAQYMNTPEATITAEVQHSERLVALVQSLTLARESAGTEKANNSRNSFYQDHTKEQELRAIFSDIQSARDPELRHDLENAHFSPKELSDLLGSMRHAQESMDIASGKIKSINHPSYGDTLHVLDSVPTQILKAIYDSRHDNESGNLKYMLRQTVLNGSRGEGDLIVAGKILARIHDVDLLQLHMHKADSDPIVRTALEQPDFNIAIIAAAETPQDDGEKAEFSKDIRDNEIRTLRQFGLSEKLTNLLSRAVNKQTMLKDKNWRTLTGDERCVDSAKVGRLLYNIRYNLSQSSVETVERVYERWGIVNIQNYSSEQLDRMSNLAEQKPEFIEHLKNGDVTVVLTDALGDHNSAFENTSVTFEKASGRTLFFEVQSPNDYYRYFAQLKRMGIKPSTVVVANHGAPGKMFFGEGNSSYVLTNHDPEMSRDVIQKINQENREQGTEEVLHPVGLLDAKGLEVIAERYMQPGKGVDDEQGTINIILKSCSQAKKRSVARREADGSLRTVDESTAETFMKKMNQRQVDSRIRMYASDMPSNMYSATDGLRYNAGSVHEFRADAEGNIIETTVETIPYDVRSKRRSAA